MLEEDRTKVRIPLSANDAPSSLGRFTRAYPHGDNLGTGATLGLSIAK